jgi:RNA polymerase sigma factor (TIGR02999 family)
MRRILIDNARRKRAAKHGGDWQREPLQDVASAAPDDNLLALDEALQKLIALDPIKGQLVELRYFAGLSGEQAAGVLNISPSAADRLWTYARAWLQAEIRGR